MNPVTEGNNRASFVTNSGMSVPIHTQTPVAHDALRHPNENILTVELQAIVHTMIAEDTPENTKKSMIPKIQEFFEFCDYLYRHDQSPRHINFEKVYRFMYYVAFREKRKQGGRKVSGIVGRFDAKEYQRVTGTLQTTGSGSAAINAPQTLHPVKASTFCSYKAAIRCIYKHQIAHQQTSLNFESIWQQSLEDLTRYVTTREPKKRRATHQEKYDTEFANYKMVEQYGHIESELWQLCLDATTARISFANLRNRYQFLHLTSGILRAESLFKAELSDFHGLWATENHYDIHKMFIMVNRIAEGKTNRGRAIYGRATRHTDVRLCCIGALAFYLQYRMFLTRELELLSSEDWLDNSRWFDIKLLVDSNGFQETEIMSSHCFAKKLGEVLCKLQLSGEKILHLGRKLGPKILELLNENSEDIRRMGNWNPSIFDKCYSTKVPLSPIKKLAGFCGSNDRYYLPRSQVAPPEQLLKATPIGTWVYDRLEAVRRAHGEAERAKHQTARNVLLFFSELNTIFLQDAAAMSVLHPGRSEQKMFRSIEVFVTVEWAVYCEQMKHSLEIQANPADVGLESVMPGVHQRFRAIEGALDRQVQATSQVPDQVARAVRTEVEEAVAVAVQGIENRALQREESNRDRLVQSLLLGIQNFYPSTRSNIEGSNIVVRASMATDTDINELDRLMGGTADETSVGNTGIVLTVNQQSEKPEIFQLQRHSCLQSLYNEWYGLGEFDDGKGGVPGRDQRSGPAWRRGKIHPKAYSRTKHVVKAVEQLALSNGISHEAAIQQIQPLISEASGSLSGMVRRLEENGYITRGKSRKRGRDLGNVREDVSNNETLL
jgi:hypothetical protein